MYRLEEPLNSNERYLHGISIRLEVLIDMLGSIIEAMSEEEDITIENNTFEEIVVEEEEEELDYTVFTVAEIKEFLEESDIPFTSRMNKSELIELLR